MAKKKRGVAKEQLNVLLPVDLVTEIREECARLRKRPGYVVQRRLCHSYGISSEFPFPNEQKQL